MPMEPSPRHRRSSNLPLPAKWSSGRAGAIARPVGVDIQDQYAGAPAHQVHGFRRETTASESSVSALTHSALHTCRLVGAQSLGEEREHAIERDACGMTWRVVVIEREDGVRDARDAVRVAELGV